MPTTLEIEQRPLGRSGLTVPRIALGCGNFGGVGSAPELFGQGLSEDQAFELMDAAWALGIGYFDTADAYGGGRSELAIGRWIASRGVRPGLTTKTYNPMDGGEDSGLSPERIERQLESSLERLGVDRVELYLAHEFDPYTPLGETIGAFEEAQAAGRIRTYGVSNFDSFQLEAATNVGSPQAIQNEHSLLGRRRGRPLGVRRAASRVLGVQPARRRLADRQVQARRVVPAGVADDAAARTVRAADHRSDVRRARSTALALRASAARRWPARRWRGCWPTIASRRSSSGPARPDHLEPVREALAHPLAADELVHLTSVFA